MRINSLIVRQTSVSFDRHDLPQTIGTLNPNHLKVSDISAHVILKALTDDSLNVNVKRLTFMEQSGLKMNRLSFKFIGGRHSSKLSGFKLQMPGTDFQLGDCQATYIMRNGKLVTPSLYYSGSIEPSHITLSDLACFLPSLKSFNSTLTISSSIEGKGEKLAVPNLSISSTTGDIDVNIDGWVDELTAREPKWQANINNLNLSAKTLDFISQNLKGEGISFCESCHLFRHFVIQVKITPVIIGNDSQIQRLQIYLWSTVQEGKVLLVLEVVDIIV